MTMQATTYEDQLETRRSTGIRYGTSRLGPKVFPKSPLAPFFFRPRSSLCFIYDFRPVRTIPFCATFILQVVYKVQLKLSLAYQYRATGSNLLRTLYHVCCVACQASDRGINRCAGRLSSRFLPLYRDYALPRIIVFLWTLLHGKLSRSRLRDSPQPRLSFLHLLASANSPKSYPSD